MERRSGQHSRPARRNDEKHETDERIGRVPPTLREHARNRGWRNLRLLSCGDSTFKYDLGSEDEDGNQQSTVSVFTRDGSGQIRHFYTAHPRMAEDINQRGLDLLCPVWHFMDLTPQGRDDWYPELEYPTSVAAARQTG